MNDKGTIALGLSLLWTKMLSSSLSYNKILSTFSTLSTQK